MRKVVLSQLVPVLIPKEIEEKNKKTTFFGDPNTFFGTQKCVEISDGSIWYLVLPSKKIKNTKVVPGTKYKVFRYSLK